MKKQMGIFLLIIIFLFIITSIHLGIARSGRIVSQVQQEVSIKQARNQYEQLEIARLSAPQRVIDFATEHLGLVEAKPHEVIVLEER